MTTPTPLPLGESAEKIQRAREEVFGLCDGKRKWTMRVPVDRERDSDCVICEALDTADRLRARVAELEGELASIKRQCIIRRGHEREDLMAHGETVLCSTELVARLYDDRIEAEAHANALRDDNEHFRKQAWERVLEANAMRDALEDAHARLASPRAKLFPNAYLLDHAAGENVASCGICAALAAHPAASMAAYRKSVLEEAQERVVAALREYHEALTRNESFLCAVAVAESKDRAIRALAAQDANAGEVKP